MEDAEPNRGDDARDLHLRIIGRQHESRVNKGGRSARRQHPPAGPEWLERRHAAHGRDSQKRTFASACLKDSQPLLRSNAPLEIGGVELADCGKFGPPWQLDGMWPPFH